MAQPRNRKHQQKVRSIVSELKLRLGCEKCGYNRSARALQFHHANGDKAFNVSRMVDQGRSLSAIMAEIAKCILLCANCHHEEHERLGAV